MPTGFAARHASLLLALALAAFFPGPALAQIPFTSIAASGGVGVDDPDQPGTLRLQVKVKVRLGPNSDGIDPLTEGLTLELEYPGAVGLSDNPDPGGIITPCLMVLVPKGVFAKAGQGYRVGLDAFAQGGGSIRLMSGAPNQILPYVELLPAVSKLDIRLGQEQGAWVLKTDLAFMASTPNGPIAGVIAILRSPQSIRLAIGTDAGEVAMRRLEFAGALPIDQD